MLLFVFLPLFLVVSLLALCLICLLCVLVFFLAILPPLLLSTFHVCNGRCSVGSMQLHGDSTKEYLLVFPLQVCC